MMRKAYRELEAKTFLLPFSLDDRFCGINHETGEYGWLPADWQMPYNPIELE